MSAEQQCARNDARVRVSIEGARWIRGPQFAPCPCKQPKPSCSPAHSAKKKGSSAPLFPLAIETIALCLTLLTTTRFVFPPSSPTVLFSFLRTAGGRDSTTPACVAWCEARCGARRGGGFKRAVFHNWFFKQALLLSSYPIYTTIRESILALSKHLKQRAWAEKMLTRATGGVVLPKDGHTRHGSERARDRDTEYEGFL